MALRGQLVVSHALPGLIVACVVALEGGPLWIALAAALVGAVVGLFIAEGIGRPLRRTAHKAAQLIGVAEQDRADQDELDLLHRAVTTLSVQLHNRADDLVMTRDRLAAVLDAMSDGVVVVGHEGRVILANPAAIRLVGASGSLIGRTVAEVLRHPRARHALDSALADRESKDVELEAVAGTSQEVLLSVRPLFDGGVCAVVHDVTRLRKLERVRRDFVTNVSHELRTPVASIQSYSETLLDGALGDPPTARKFVEVIHRNAARIGRLVRDLLQLSQLESRRANQLVREPMVLAEIAEAVRDTVANRATQMEMRVDLAIPDELRALGDPDGVEQMLLNLVDNALKYGKPGGRVTVGAEVEEDEVVVTIADDGPGIESRHLPRIFERFYRIDAGQSSDSGGTGLGLAIVKHLAESMGGGVEVESTLGRGSAFRIRLPRP